MDLNCNSLEWIARLPRLKKLTIGASKLRRENFQQLAALKRFEGELDLYNTGVTDQDLVHVAALERLTVLKLGYNQITDIGLESLKRMKQLEELRLDSSKVSDAGLQHLLPLSKLKVLTLNNTQITDNGLKLLTKLPNLILLEVNHTKVSQDAVKDFRTSLPECRIEYEAWESP